MRSSRKSFIVMYLVIIIVIVTGYFLLFFFHSSLDGHTLCLFKNMTGVACPACGSTRATALLLHGELMSSLLLNPLAVVTNIGILVSVMWMFVDIVRVKETFFPFLSRNWPLAIKLVVLVLILSNWVWNIVKGL